MSRNTDIEFDHDVRQVEDFYMANAEIARSDIEIHSRLKNRLWTVFHNIPRIYESLLAQLGPIGLTTADIRTDAGDGSLAGFNLNFWLFQFRLLVRVRLDSVEMRWNGLTAGDVPSMVDALDRVLSAVAHAGENTVPSTHEISAALHFVLENTSANDVIKRFAPTVPEIGPGPLLGTGVAMYYGPRDEVLSSSLGLEPSTVIPQGLFARITISCDGALSTHRLQERLENQIHETLRTFGFDWKR